MPSADGPGAAPEGSGQANPFPGEQVPTQLVEALMLLLIEKGVLTRNDALSIVQTVAQVQRGRSLEGMEPEGQTPAAVDMLKRMYASFEALVDGAAAPLPGGENIVQLRPPIYGDRAEFPTDD